MSPAKCISAESLAKLPRCMPENVPPARAWFYVQQLGQAFARWAFHPALLEQAAKYLQDHAGPASAEALCQRPQLPEASGCCWVAFVITPTGSYPSLRSACVLPLRWRLGTSHSSALPQTLVDLADEVYQRLRQEASGGSPYHQEWGLHLAPGTGLETYDFSLLQSITCHSGFASLAAGLVVAAEGGMSRSKVWASASWNEDLGFDRVDGLAAKLQLAADWGATDFFVARSQVDEARAATSQQHLTLAIHGLVDVPPAGSRERAPAPVKSALKPYLERLETPPTADASPQQRTAYYLRVRQHDSEAARQYYRRFLLSDIAERCRALLPDDFTPPAVLVTVLSHSPELVSLATSVIRPRLCIVLYTPTLQEHLTAEIRWIQESLAIDVTPMEVAEDPTVWFDQLSAMLRARLADAPPGPVFIDLTPGLKYMTAGLTLAARSGDRLLYLIHEYKDGPVPLTEQPLVREVPTSKWLNERVAAS
jgi:hypothetical protein